MPGRSADDYRPFGAGKLIPAGSDISVQVHYTPIGKEIVDRPLIGFTVADKAPAKRWMSYGIVGGGPDFAIPPNEGNYKSPPFDLTFTADVELVEFMPHMHVRGKSMTYHLVYPDGRDQIVLSVPKYDFNWQLLYQPAKTIRVPKGTRMYVEAYYDNSKANRFNPNPERTVYLGRMTWEEMMAPFFGVLIDSKRGSEPGAEARSLRGAGKRRVMRRAMWTAGLVMSLAASTSIISAQGGGKPMSGGNPTPGTPQPDPPNLSDRITVTGCLQPAPKSAANSETPDPNTPSDARFVLSNAKRVDRLPPGTGGSPLAVEHQRLQLSTRGNRQPVFAVREREGRGLGRGQAVCREDRRADAARRVHPEDRCDLSALTSRTVLQVAIARSQQLSPPVSGQPGGRQKTHSVLAPAVGVRWHIRCRACQVGSRYDGGHDGT